MKLQDKKRNEKAHKNEKVENYYSYDDSVVKNMAFIPFTNVHYKMEKPITAYMILFFRKGSDKILVDDTELKKERF